MAVVPLTLTISLCLVFTFVVFFLREHSRGRLSSAERDSLLPLADETPRLPLARGAERPGLSRGAAH
jgi:cbb3-type cytochrome oxidase subunit 3